MRPEHQHADLRVREIAQRHLAQTARQFRAFVDQPLGGAPREARNDGVTDRLGREQPLGQAVEPETVAGEVEFGDMAASVAHQPTDADRARHDLEPPIGRIALGEDFLVPRVAAARADLLQRDQGDPSAPDCAIPPDEPGRSNASP